MKLTLFMAWALLSLATLLSWALDASGTGNWIGTAVLVVAFFKARVVLLVFMEFNASTPALRWLCEAWVLAAGSVVIATYWLAPKVSPLAVTTAL